MRTFLATLFGVCIILIPLFVIYQLWWPLFFVWALACFLLLYPTLRPNCGWFGPVITRFQTDRREVWLTLDDGPHPLNTPQILCLLEKYRAKATFFIIGQHALQHPTLIQAMIGQGHHVGNHTQTHPVASFWMSGPQRMARELDGCHQSLSTISGVTPTRFFRAPVGMANFCVRPVLLQRGLHLIGWSARGFDAVWRNPARIVERIWRDVSPGAILLLHEGHRGDDSAQQINLQALELLLQRLTADGYACVLPSENQWKLQPK
jgi:peptidoglycan-N-acetylglucosamine deacetylase